MRKKDPLGRGLSAILKDVDEGGVHLIPVQQIVLNPTQPRIEMRQESLVELASSIEEKGLRSRLSFGEKRASTRSLRASAVSAHVKWPG